MATNCGDLKENGCELESFEKNNYFYGKLISARDMTLEQRTNERKLYTINRLVLGSGLVCGLEVTKVEEINNDLMVSIQPGLAIDGYGRLIVVSEPKIVKAISDGNKDTGSSDTLYLYLKYRNCSKEYVPVSGNDDACQEKCCYNRIREVFDIVYSTTNVVTDERKKKEIAFITEILEDFKKDAKLEKLDLAQKYYKDILMSGCVKTSELVLLGVFKKGGDKIWSPDTDNRYASCSIVYDNVMLYNIINVLKEEINELRKKINTISIPTSKVKVPDVVGDKRMYTEDDARIKLESVGLKKGTVTETGDVLGGFAGFVCDQDPKVTHDPVSLESSVNISVFKENLRTVPDYVAYSRNNQITLTQMKHYKVAIGHELNDGFTWSDKINTVPLTKDRFNDQVKSHSPEPGEKVDSSAVIVFTVYQK